MEGDLAYSPKRKQNMKKMKLSKTVGGKVSKKEAILNRMSSGKKRPRSEPRIRKESGINAKGDFLAKRLVFQGNDDEGEDDDDDDEEKQSYAKQKKKSIAEKQTPKKASKAKARGHGGSTATSKWQVTDSKSMAEKPGQGASALKKDVKKTKEKKVLKSRHENRRDDEDEEYYPLGRQDEESGSDDENDDDDNEVDFPVLKRKSLGLHGELPGENQLLVQGKKISIQGEEELKIKEKEKVKGGKEKSSQQQRAKGEETRQEGKKKRKKRGKKRTRSSSESEEPQSKREKQGNEFLVRCGNLPVGTSKSDLSMFFGEADIFPQSIIIKSKKTSAGNRPIKYATFVCSSAEEVERLCELNGISMPSTVGNRECRLLIHRLNAGDANDMQFKRKLFIRNLHPKITEDELFEYFEENKFHPTNVIFPGRSQAKKPRKTALVWLKSSGDVDRAVGLQNPTLRDQVFIIARSNVSSHAAQEP